MDQRRTGSVVLSVIGLSGIVAIFALVMLWRLASDGHDDVTHRALAVPGAFLGLALAAAAVITLARLVASLESRMAVLEAERAAREVTTAPPARDTAG